jgi:hypothetical protein
MSSRSLGNHADRLQPLLHHQTLSAGFPVQSATFRVALFLLRIAENGAEGKKWLALVRDVRMPGLGRQLR